MSKKFNVFADATSDASDIEKRIRQLEEELLKRRRDLDRIRKKREKDQLRKQEQKLKKELKVRLSGLSKILFLFIILVSSSNLFKSIGTMITIGTMTTILALLKRKMKESNRNDISARERK